MSRILKWLLVLVIGFGLGVATATLWLRHKPIPVPVRSNTNDVATDLPILAYCELASNRDKYNGQLVRVGTRLIGFIHGIEFYDENCPGDTQAAVIFDPQHKDEVERDLKQARGSDNWLEPVDIIALGRFKKVTPSNESDTIYSTASLRFEIVHIEKASKVRWMATGSAQQSLAADGAIACFSSNLFLSDWMLIARRSWRQALGVIAFVLTTQLAWIATTRRASRLASFLCEEGSHVAWFQRRANPTTRCRWARDSTFLN
jgi:hypothetical protein